MQTDLEVSRITSRAIPIAAALVSLLLSAGHADAGKSTPPVPDTKIYTSECMWDVPLSTRAMGYITPGDYVIVFSTLQPVALVQSARVMALASGAQADARFAAGFQGAKLAIPRSQAKALAAMKFSPDAHFEVRGTAAPGKPKGRIVRFKADGITPVVKVDKDGNKLPDIHCVPPATN